MLADFQTSLAKETPKFLDNVKAGEYAVIRNQFCNVKINYITCKLIRKQLCTGNVIQCPHGMLCNNTADYITEEIIRETNSVM